MDYSIKEDLVEYLFEKIKLLILPSESSDYRSRFLQSNFLLFCIVLFSALRIFATVVSINFPQNIFFADITKAILENSVNQTRQSAGLQPLTENEKLNQAAQLKAENMVQDKYFDHTSPSGVTPWFWFLKAGYSYKYAGENLAIGFFDSGEVYNAWLNSPSHKANIINPNYTEVGTAILSGFGSNNTIIVVQEFGSQLPTTTKPSGSNSRPVATQATESTRPVATQATESTRPVAIQATENTKTEAVAPGPTAGSQATTVNTNEKVLSQFTEAQNSLELPKSGATNSLFSKLANFVIYDYEALLRDIIYGFSVLIVGILLSLIFRNLNIKPKRELVLRVALIMVLLSAATLINKEVIVFFIPHQILI